MSHDPVPAPAQPPDARSFYSWFSDQMQHCPQWVRNIVVLLVGAGLAYAVGSTTGIFGPKKVEPVTNLSQFNTTPPLAVAPNAALPIAQVSSGGSYPMGRGTQVSIPGKSDNETPDHKQSTQQVTKDDSHSDWHMKHVQDDPPWTVIEKTDDLNFVQFKYYAKTDRCIYLLRNEGGRPTDAWIRDPLYSDAPAPATTPNHGATQLPHKPGSRLAGGLIPAANAASLPFSQDSPLQPVQASCPNPHPGPFKWWWGPAVDQCWSPMYRQFNDGCTHYQMYNRCANAWDGRIFWTYCKGGGHY